MSKPHETINVMSVKWLTPLGVIVALKSINDGVIEDNDVNVGLVCQRMCNVSFRNDDDKKILSEFLKNSSQDR